MSSDSYLHSKPLSYNRPLHFSSSCLSSFLSGRTPSMPGDLCVGLGRQCRGLEVICRCFEIATN
ncbi:hypothetical protein TorRG33x02_351240 [Trema orientale]|uniref:Uncharacterized protein n=1 Tax=Trema orientale TaxID=63057 RepID=A0A2P5AG32_TREOI|nr:hypothetical protein TorRG33x02_351240 [Trema orientale]